MRMPMMSGTSKATSFVQQFYGYNHNLRIDAGELFDMKNISMDHYPVIGTRHGEMDRLALIGTPNGLHEYLPNSLMAVCGDILYVGITDESDGEAVPESTDILSASEKSFATIGIYTVIMPDKAIYNSKTGELTSIENKHANKEIDSAWVIIRTFPCDILGVVEDFVDSDSEPSDTTKLWYDTSSGKWKKYNSTSQAWAEVSSQYWKIQAAASTVNTRYSPVSDPSADLLAGVEELSDYLGSFQALDVITYTGPDDSSVDYVIFGTGTDEDGAYIVLVPTAELPSGKFELMTKCPELEHLVSLNNRVWGVNNETHEIFACKLGDPTQWFSYPGIASDSYAVSLGFADEVTGSAAYNNYVHFFTETKIIKFYGDYPSNYQMHTYKANGVRKGMHDTIVQVEGALYWLSPIGVVAYDGSLPYFRGQKFSPNFFDDKHAVAGRDGYKYCISVSDNTGYVAVFTYDTHNGLWSVEGDQKFAKTAQMDNALCVLNTQTRIIAYYDRSRTRDYVVQHGNNLVSIDREPADY